MGKLKIAVLFGGCSEEHDISIKSAVEIAKSLDPDKYEPVYIGISKTGVWKQCPVPCADWERGACTPAVLSPDRGVHGIVRFLKDGTCRTDRIDAVLPVLHGKTGEDGAVQGLLELSGIPYVGCGIQSSAVCMDKSLAYIVARNAGIRTPNFLICTPEKMPDGEELCYPVFVKPARSGSSFGISKVQGREELLDAISKALVYDVKVVIEEAVVGKETGCAVMGNGNRLAVGEVDQILLSHGFFRIHQEKTPESGSENARVIVPADIPPESRLRVQETAKAIYRALDCRGLARVDMFLQEDGQVVLNEVNTFPGCTSYSRYPRMMAAAGVSLSEVMDTVIGLSLEESGR